MPAGPSGESTVTRLTGLRPLLLGALILAGTATAHPARAPGLAALSSLEPGLWELKARGKGGEYRRLCLGDPRQLLQIRHGRSSCRRFVVTDSPHHVVVTYDCDAAGNGRTDLRVETRRLVQIQSQGIAGGAPFSFAMEGRRVGGCR